MELYDQVQNPIDDSKVIEKLITLYSETNKGGFYSKLTRTTQKDYIAQRRIVDSDKFYSMMFNKWKNSIVTMKKSEFDVLYKQGSYGKDLIKLREYLKTIPDVTTKQETLDIFFGEKKDKELEDAIEKYRWNAHGEESGWVHVCSRYVTAKKDKYPNVEHRLYLNTESIDTHNMATLFVEKCNEHQLPYYFKFNELGSRDDTIVIYSSSENLDKYIEILREIKRDHPDLISETKDPPILTGKVDGWIGYGSEPKLPNGKKSSFNVVRADVIESAIEKATKKWILGHRNMQIKYQGQKVSFQEYITMKSIEEWLVSLEENCNYNSDKEKRKAKKEGRAYDELNVVKNIGYTLNDLKSPQFRQSLYSILNSKMGENLSNICGTANNMDTVIMNVKYNNKISFDESDLNKVIRKISANIMKKDPNFISAVQMQIKNDSKPYGIDTNKFCFDIQAREALKVATNQVTQAQPKPVQVQKVSVQQKPKNFNDVFTEDNLINQIDSIMEQYEQEKETIYSSNIVSDEILNRALAEMSMEDGNNIDSNTFSGGTFRR